MTKARPQSLVTAGNSIAGATLDPQPDIKVPLSPRSSLNLKHSFSASLARPDDDGTSSLTLGKITSKWSKEKDIKTSAEVARPENDQLDKDLRIKNAKLACGETSISKKEEVLEQIMCAEAHATFERTARHQLNREFAMRATINPDAMGIDMNALSQFYLDDRDITEPDSDSDDDMIVRCEFVQYDAGSGEEHPSSPTLGLRYGFGFPQPHPRHRQSRYVPQDRIFVSYCGKYKLMGIINCHGSQEVGPELAQFIAKEMPKSFFKSPWLTQENDPATALSHAFDRTHRKAIKQVDCRLTGACCTVVLLDDTSVYIANVGDCKAVLAVPDPNVNAEKYHFVPVALTVDHKLSVRAEFDRILEYGGEVRRCINDNVHRLFFKDDSIPGLVLTRGIGHRMAHPVGISHIPAIQVLQRSELNKDSFIVLGSGGIWNAMSERAIVNWIGAHFADPGEAARSVGLECQRRWEDPSKRLKAFVAQDAGDSFSSLLLYPSLESSGADIANLGETGAVNQPPRQFQLGPHQSPVAKREWKDVRQMNWKHNLARILR
jgi:serine/threonine protein phosphatase PrpC